MPSGVPVDEDGLPLTYVGSEVALQNRKMTQFGRANQKWEMDVSTGLIEAFVTDKWDKGECHLLKRKITVCAELCF